MKKKKKKRKKKRQKRKEVGLVTKLCSCNMTSYLQYIHKTLCYSIK